MTESKRRVVIFEPVLVFARRTAEVIRAVGEEPVIVTSAADARRASGPFQRGVFAFDLPDASGVVLAAELLLEGRVQNVEFFHPEEERECVRERTRKVPAIVGKQGVAHSVG